MHPAGQKLPGVDLRYGWQWESSEADADGVTSIVRDLGSNQTHEVRSRWVVAADGAGSRVRRSLGIEMQGPPRIQSFLMIHFGANLREMVKDRLGVLHFVIDPEAGGAFITHDIDREWVYMHDFDPDTESETAYDDHDHDDFESFALALGEVADVEAFAERLGMAIRRHDILRLKGFAAVAGRPMRLVVQAVGPRVETWFDRPFGAEPRQTRLVVIGTQGLDRGLIESALAP